MKNNLEGIRTVATYQCNRNCKFCYQKTKDSVFLDPLKYKNILEELDFMPIYITHQGGELSNFPKETIELCKIADKIFPQVFRKSITSNGYGNFDFYNSLKLYGITHLTFSLHEKNTYVENIIKQLSKSGFYTVRVNCYLSEDSSKTKYVLNFCEKYDIQLTLCEDLGGVNINNYDFSKYQKIEYKHQTIFQNGNFRFWLYHHIDKYDYNNLIIMPNGKTTVCFNDVIDGKNGN